MTISRSLSHPTRHLPNRKKLFLALGITLGVSGVAYGQSTTGTIFGTAPTASGETVLIQSSNGVNREVPVDSTGHYSASRLPLSNYTVTLKRDGKTLEARNGVTLVVGAGTQVSFGAAGASGDTTNLAGLTVTASALPPIDVSQVDSRTVITAEQLKKLPISRSAEAIAILAPGVNTGSGYYTSPTGQTLVSFGGSSVAENAYYINGFNTTDPLHNFGGLTLPYGSIDQEQVLTGGYGAAYGRSDGGVLSMVGKRGSNDWHFGASETWVPSQLQSDPDNSFYPKGAQFLTGPNSQQGQIYQYRKNNTAWSHIEDVYVGGPLIKDKLFFFGSVEADHSVSGDTISNVNTQTDTTYNESSPKWYAKVDWNITDKNILELTGASNKTNYSGNTYAYAYTPGQTKGMRGDFLGPATHTKDGADLWVAKYTGYITDNLTVEALYGKMRQTDYSEAAGGNDAYITDSQYQNPDYLGGSPLVGTQINQTVSDPRANDKTSNLRLDVNYKVGSHSITAGIDNLTTQAINIGTTPSGPGYYWVYGQGAPNLPISSLAGQEVGAPGGQGYYVAQEIYSNSASARVKQTAQFIEDQWQISDRVLLNLGLRNDQFTNYNPDNVAYLRLTKPQLAPRLGASWDVLGDSSFKIYGNAGRYYLAEPANVAIRGAAGSTFTDQYFTYTGIDPNTGAPTGLVQIPQGHYPGVSANNEFGVPPDPKSVTSKNVKAEYQDEYIVGFDKTLGPSWTYGARAQYRIMRTALDDVCDDGVIQSYAVQQGIDPVAALGSNGCYILNPGHDSQINVANGAGGYSILNIPWSAWNQPKLQRKYGALEAYLQHPFDGTWYGKIDYVASRSFGNYEGSVLSSFGQQDVSQTEAWDNSGVMTYSGGAQANDRTHQLKAIAYYQITPEWLVGANLQVLSGLPKACYGYFGAAQSDPFHYGSSYHFCGPQGTPAKPGSTGRTPWQEILSVNTEYRPLWAGKKLAFDVDVFNILNQQRITQYDATSESGAGVLSSTWNVPITIGQPRYVRFQVSYDF